jgi:uncharacterized protein
MQVLVAGGTGLIGGALVGSLLADGHRVTVLSRTPERGGLPAEVELALWDAETVGPWVDALAACEAVVHLAGENIAGRWTAKKKQRLRDSRVRSAEALAAAIGAVAHRPRVLVQASAVGYYGDGGDREITEADPPGDHFLARVAREWEAASAGVEALGVRRVLLRTGIVLARHGGALPLMALPFRFFVGGAVAGGDHWVPWIHLADEVGAIRFLLGHEGASGPFNLAAPEPVTQRRLARALGAVLGRPSWLPMPAFAVRAALGELGAMSLMSQRAVPARLLELGYAFRFPHLDLALRDLLAT